MRNLSLWDVKVKTLDINAEDDFLISYGYNEQNRGELYLCDYNLLLRSFDENCEGKWCKDLSEGASPDNKPVDVSYLSLPNSVCVGLSNGELFTVSDEGTSCDLVGVCDDGLLAMQWSPDQELLVLVTKTMKMILMSCTFDAIHEVDLMAEEFGESQFVTVGWGKKETQFHGREGKQARTQVEVTPDPNISSDERVRITWRGDGNLYAVGFNVDGLRRFKVFDKEGRLQYTSEKQPGLESNLCWRPSGNVIATTQRLPDKYVIAFFEKNGLKHGGFDIPVNAATVVEDLSWNSDSEVITLHCRDKETNMQKILLFTMGNYHWYLKQTLVFDSKQSIKILWDNSFDVENNKKMHVVLHNGQYVTYTWVWSVDHSNGKNDDDDAVVAVIDGNKVLVTGFRQTVVPPPMAALEIEVPTTVNSVHFAPANSQNEDTNSFFITTSGQKLIFYEQTNKFPLQYKQGKSFNLDKNKIPLQCYNWHWLNDHFVVCITVDEDNTHSIVDINIQSDDTTSKNVTILPDTVFRIESHPNDSSKLFLQLITGDILEYTTGGNIEPKDVSFKHPCPKFNVISIDDELHFLGLSHNGHLYIDDDVAMTNASSFFVHSHFLLITTLQHFLLCTELNKSGLAAIIENSKNESAYVYKRKIERGAKLVVSVPNHTRTVLQMPRGNLETIQPRPLSLKIIGQHLDALRYHEAFDLMRKERINLNLIYDHDPEKFISNIKVFLESVKNNSWLSLFLSDLENVDVTKTMYSSSYADRKDKNTCNNVKDKIKKVCLDIRSHLNAEADCGSRILPVLTSLVKTNEIRDLESALSVVKDLKAKEINGAKLPVGSDEALKYLLYMVDVNRLFDVALGMYDFELVLLVANKSQKDPKEFIPLLNEFNEMEENYKRFSINKHLKRFDEAVKYLVKCGKEKHEELKTFVKYHSLYTEALVLFTPEDEIYKEIADDFGSYLRLKKQFAEAGVVYQRGSNYDKAIECYKDALEWELAINLAHSWPTDKLQELCGELINALKEEKRHKEALVILEQYYKDKEETILYAITSGQFKTALRLCTQYNNPEIMDKHLLPALLEEHQNLLDQVETNFNTFIRHRDRLRIVRETKRQNPIDIYDPGFGNKDSDLYSDAGSTIASSSRGSSKSFRSSKNRRKHERKVASLKEGSQYEDVALVMALHTLVTSSFELRTLVREVNMALGCFGRNKEAFVLQTSLERLLKEMKDSFREIWTNELVLEAANAVIAAESAPEGVSVIPQGIASLEPHMRIVPAIQDVSWKLDGLF